MHAIPLLFFLDILTPSFTKDPKPPSHKYCLSTLKMPIQPRKQLVLLQNNLHQPKLHPNLRQETYICANNPKAPRPDTFTRAPI
jgi:hypothetical protein